jgi:hypothetical protein
MWTKAVESNFKVLYRHLREPKKLTKTLSWEFGVRVQFLAGHHPNIRGLEL